MSGGEQEGGSQRPQERLTAPDTSALEAAARVKREVREIELEIGRPTCQKTPKMLKKHGKSRSMDDAGSKVAGTCRICMEMIPWKDIKSGQALALGCKCSNGMDVCHMACACKWFKIRKSTTCEICESEATKLPRDVQHEIRELARRARRDANGDSVTRFPMEIRHTRRTQSEELHLCTYTTFCLLPAALSAIIMVFFYFECLNLEVLQTMVLAIAVSSLTMVHWLIEPNRPMWHMVFVITFIGSIMGLSYMFIIVHQWSSLASCISGAIVGAFFSVGVYTAVRAVATLLANPFNDSHPHRSSQNAANDNTWHV